MKKVYGLILSLLLISQCAQAQYLSVGSVLDITATTTFTGGNLYGSAIITIKSGAVVTFTGSVGLSGTAQLIVEPGAKVIITTGGLGLSNSSIVTTNGALAVRGGGMNISNNASISFSGINKDTIIGNVNFSNNVVTTVGEGTDLYIGGNVTASNNSGFDVDGSMSVNGNISTTNNTTFSGNGDVTSTGSMVGGNNSNMFGQEPFNCSTGPCSGRDFCSSYNNTISSSKKIGACSGAAFTITANTVASATYLWQSTTSLGGTWSSASGTNNAKDYSSSGLSTTTYFRRRVVASGCTTYSSVVTVYGTPPPSPTATSTPFCGSGSVTLTAYNSPGTYQWYTSSSGSTAISGATNSTYTTPVLTSSTTYYVTSVIGNCESATRTAVTAGPISPPTVTDNAQCGSGNITLTAFGSPTGVQRWYTAATGGSPVNTTSVYTFWTSTTKTFYVSSVYGACESSRVPVTATVLSSLSTPSVTSNSPLCAGSTLTLSTGTVTGATYSWTGPSSFTSTQQNPTITAVTTAMAGTYSVTVSASGCTSVNGSTSVTINNAPTTPTGVSGNTICSGNTATLTASGGSGTSYKWYTASSGGTLLSSSNPYTTGILNSNATYYVASVAAGGCESSTRLTVNVTVNALATVPTGKTGTTTICSGSSTTVTATGGTGTGYAWYTASSGGTLLASTAAYTTPTLTSNTTYYVERTNAAGCPSATRLAVIITVNPTPSAPTAGSNSPVCRGSAINLTASTVSSATYAWTGPNSFTSSSQNPSLASATTAMGGTYNVTATVSGCTSTTGSVVVNVQDCGNVWTGATSTSWTTGSNWLLGVVPVTTDSVTIPSGAVRMPILSSNQTLKALNVTSGASMIMNDPSVLSLTSGLTVGGTLTNTGGTISFIGGTNQYINGNIVFNNLTVNGSGTVQVQTSVSVNGAITLTSGTIQSNGNLILNLDNGYIARGGSGSISGNMTVTRTISSNRTHYFSVPLDGATVADLTDDAEVFNSANGVSRLFQYYEPGNAWERITSPTAALIKGKGYSLYFLTPTVLDITGTYDHSYVHTVTLNNSNTNWKFVGNPYPGTIDWDAASGWTKTNLNNAVNYWEGSSGQYISYVAGVGTTVGGKTADRYIPAMNGFWIQPTGTGGTATLAMNSLVRTTNSKSFYREMDMSNVYSLVLSNGTQSDEAIIRFNDGSDPSFEGDLDAKKINNTGSIPSVASTMVGSTMAINTMPLLSTETIIPLYVKVGSNNAAYTLKWSNKNNPLYGTQFYLLDKKLGTSTALVEDELYTISQLTTDSTNRYELKLVSELTTPTPPTPNLTTGTQSALQSSVRVYAKDGKVYVEGIGSSTKEVEGDILTLGGTSIDRFSGVIGEGVSIQRTLSQVSSSMYLVRISSEGQQATYRVVMY